MPWASMRSTSGPEGAATTVRCLRRSLVRRRTKAHGLLVVMNLPMPTVVPSGMSSAASSMVMSLGVRVFMASPV